MTIRYHYYIITDMRRLLVTLDDEMDKELAKFPNQAEIVREALRLYHGNIKTDTLARLRTAFVSLSEKLDETNSKLDRLLSRIPE